MKGLVMERTAKGVYVITPAGDFQYVKGHTHLPVGSEISVKSAPVIPYRKIIAAVACLALILVSATTVMWNTQRFAVFVDINPSFQINFNMFDCVLGVTPLNAEGEDFLRDLNVGGDYRKALSTVMDAVGSLAAKSGDYDSDIPYVQLTVAARQEKSQEKYEKQVNDYISNLDNRAVVKGCTTEERATATTYGISPGKLQMAEAALRFLPENNLDSVVQLSTAELHLSAKEGDALTPHVEAARTSLDTATTAARNAESAAHSAQTSAQVVTDIEMSDPDDDRQARLDALAQEADLACSEAQAAAIEADGAAQAAVAEAQIAAQGESIVALALAQEAECIAQEALWAAQSAAAAADAAAKAAAKAHAALQREADRLANGGNNGSPGGQNSGNGNTTGNNGSPGGQNSGNGNTTGNNGSPGGENSGKGNTTGNNGTPGGENSGKGND